MFKRSSFLGSIEFKPRISMVHHDIFREQLGIKYPTYGHALWEPSPGKLYSAVEVGDVGYIREGKFHRLFNALLPADHASHLKFGVPEYHEPLVPNLSDHIDTGTLGANHYCSPGITVVDSILSSLASKYSQHPVRFLSTDTYPGQTIFQKSHFCAEGNSKTRFCSFR